MEKRRENREKGEKTGKLKTRGRAVDDFNFPSPHSPAHRKNEKDLCGGRESEGRVGGGGGGGWGSEIRDCNLERDPGIGFFIKRDSGYDTFLGKMDRKCAKKIML